MKSNSVIKANSMIFLQVFFVLKFFIHILFKDNKLSKRKKNKLKARCFFHPDEKQEEEDYITVNIKQ
jgi:hypothetical protein